MTPEQIAKGLTEAQREALVTQPRSHDVWGNPDQYCLVLRVGTLNALYGKGLIELGASDTRVRLTPLGQQVRAILEQQP